MLTPGQLGLTQKDVDDAFAPFILASYGHLDWRWLRTVARLAWARKRLAWRRRLGRYNPTQVDIARSYDDVWSVQRLTQQVAPDSSPTPSLWRGGRGLAGGFGTKRVHLLALMRAFEFLKPTSILEVGAGNGVNLMILAARFPQAALSGIELTNAGVDAGRLLQTQARLPDELVAFSPLPLYDTSAHTRISLQQGDARRLPFLDRSFDAVFTALALEQMEEIRDAALREASRVARQYVVMIEPFADFNDRGIRRDHVVGSGYFAASVSDLARYGLEPVLVWNDMPRKVSLWPALVIAKVVESRVQP